MKIKTSETNRTLSYLLIGVAVILTINALVFRYPFHVIIPFIKALLLIAGIFIYGFSILKLFGTREIKFDAAAALGMIFTVFFFYIAAFLKILSLPVLLIFYLSPLPLLFLMLKKQETDLTETLRSFLKRPAYEYLLFLFPLIYASLPSSFYDTLVFHLGIPNLYLQHSGFIATPQFLYGNFSIYYELLLIPSVFAGDLVPRLFHFLIAVMLIFSVTDFSVEFFNVKQRKMYVLAAVSIPLTVFLVTTIKGDLPAAFFIFLGIKYFLKNKTFFSAVMWGFAMGIKYTNIIPLIIFLPLIHIKKKSFNIKKILVFGIIIFLLVLPLFVKNYIFAHNPFYPFFYDTFKSNAWDAGRHAGMKKDSGGIFDSVKDFITFPYTLSFGEVGIGGIPGPLFLIFLPFLLVRREKNNLLLIFSLLLLFTGPWFKASIRCWYIAFLFLTIYVVRVYETGTKKIMKVVFFVIIGLNVITAFAFQERAYKSHYLLSGKFDKEEYKAALFPTYPAFSYVNRTTPKGSKILILGESRNFYLKRPYYVASPYDYSILRNYLNKSRDRVELAASLKRDGIRYIIYNSKEFERLQRSYKRMTESELSRFNLFIGSMNPLFGKDGVYVFEIE